MDKKSKQVLVEIIAEYSEIDRIDQILTKADPLAIKISVEPWPTKFNFESTRISYKIDQEALSFVALSDDWLYTRLRMFPPISLKDSYRTKT